MWPALSGEAIILPLAVSSTNTRAGIQHPTKNRLMRLVRAIGKLVVEATVGQRPRMVPLTTSATGTSFFCPGISQNEAPPDPTASAPAGWLANQVPRSFCPLVRTRTNAGPSCPSLNDPCAHPRWRRGMRVLSDKAVDSFLTARLFQSSSVRMCSHLVFLEGIRFCDEPVGRIVTSTA